MPREASPVLGGSTFMTWAPRSARSLVDMGPASACDKSMTRIPSRGPPAFDTGPYTAVRLDKTRMSSTSSRDSTTLMISSCRSAEMTVWVSVRNLSLSSSQLRGF